MNVHILSVDCSGDDVRGLTFRRLLVRILVFRFLSIWYETCKFSINGGNAYERYSSYFV